MRYTCCKTYESNLLSSFINTHYASKNTIHFLSPSSVNRLTFDDLLDEGVEVDGERQEDLHVGQRQRVLVEGEEHVQLLLVPVVL